MSYPKNHLLPVMFSSRSFMVRSWNFSVHLILFWVNYCERCNTLSWVLWGLVSFFCMWLSSFSSIIYWRDCPLSLHGFGSFIVLSICICMSLFLGFLFLFHWSVCHYSNTIQFWLLWLCSIVWYQEVLCLLVCFFKIALAI